MKNKNVKQATLSIDFLIIGGGIGGLACAIALRRVGHRVTVLEQDSRLDMSPGGCRLAPNLSKILYHWGLEDEIHSIAIKSESISISLYETGELLGTHHWDDEVMKETRGEFVFARHSDLRKLLYDTARSCGIDVRLCAAVTSVDPDQRTVTLRSGGTLQADVIVGADGPSGLTRHHLQDQTQARPGALNMYSTTVTKDQIMADPKLVYLYQQTHTTMFNWFGNNHSVLGFPIGDGSEFAMYIYGPNRGHGGGHWDTKASNNDLESILKTSEPSLRKLGKLAAPPTCVSVDEYPILEEWVHESGRMVIIGEAAHPLPPGSVQACAMSIEDGAVLAKLFSHLRTKDQISSFLWAFQDLRQPRCDSVMAKEAGIVLYMTMPPGEHQECRDNGMRIKRDAGIGILQAFDDQEESAEWAEIKEVFGYDAEDEADNWWVEWGLLRERSMGVDVSFGIPTQVDQVVWG